MPAGSADRDFVLKFWLRMGEIYGGLWTTKQGLLPSDLWVQCLLSVGEDRVKSAIKQLLGSGLEYPPNLIEFKGLCRVHAAHRPMPKRISTAISSVDVAKQHLSAIRSSLRGGFSGDNLVDIGGGNNVFGN